MASFLPSRCTPGSLIVLALIDKNHPFAAATWVTNAGCSRKLAREVIFVHVWDDRLQSRLTSAVEYAFVRHIEDTGTINSHVPYL